MQTRSMPDCDKGSQNLLLVMTYKRGGLVRFRPYLGPADGLHFGEVGIPHHPPRAAVRCRAAVARQQCSSGTGCSAVPLGQSAAEAVLFCSGTRSETFESSHAVAECTWLVTCWGQHLQPSHFVSQAAGVGTCCCTGCVHILRVGPMQRQRLESPRCCCSHALQHTPSRGRAQLSFRLITKVGNVYEMSANSSRLIGFVSSRSCEQRVWTTRGGSAKCSPLRRWGGAAEQDRQLRQPCGAIGQQQQAAGDQRCLRAAGPHDGVLPPPQHDDVQSASLLLLAQQPCCFCCAMQGYWKGTWCQLCSSVV
jgi:hypothetical protein